MEWPVVSPRATWRQTQCEEEGSAHRNGGSHYEKQVWREILQQYGWPQLIQRHKANAAVTGLKPKIWGFLDFAEDLVTPDTSLLHIDRWEKKEKNFAR